MNRFFFYAFLFLTFYSCNGNSQEISTNNKKEYHNLGLEIPHTPNMLFLRGTIDSDSVSVNLFLSTIGENYYIGIITFDKDKIPVKITGSKTIFIDNDNYACSLSDITQENLDIKEHGNANTTELSLYSENFRIEGTMDSVNNVIGAFEYRYSNNNSNKSVSLYRVNPNYFYRFTPYFAIVKKTNTRNISKKFLWGTSNMDSININDFRLNTLAFATEILNISNFDTLRKPNTYTKKEYEAKISPQNCISTIISYCNNNVVSGFFEVTYRGYKKSYWQSIPFTYDLRHKKQLLLSDVLVLNDTISNKILSKIPPDYQSEFSPLSEVPLFINQSGLILVKKFQYPSEDLNNNFIFIPFSEINQDITPTFKISMQMK
jgi:hypothetical protein